MADNVEAENDGVSANLVDEIDLREIGLSLIELAERLERAGERLKDRHVLEADGSVSYWVDERGPLDDSDVSRENSLTHRAFRDTLRDLREFRRSYDRWERLIAEFGLTQLSYTQRDMAQSLGVAVSTVNRWAQHPLQAENYRDN